MTDTKLGPEVLAELERLEKAATPGPWGRHSISDGECDVALLGSEVINAPVSAAGNEERDTDLICSLRNAAPALLAMARRLGEVEREAGADRKKEFLIAQRDAAEDTVIGLRGLLTAANARVAELTQRAEAAEAKVSKVAEALRSLAHSHDGFHTVDCHAEGANDDEVCRLDHSDHPLECAEPHCDCGATASRDAARATLAPAKSQDGTEKEE